MKTTILLLLCTLPVFTSRAQDMKRLGQSLEKAALEHRLYKVRYVSQFKFQSEEDTIFDTVTALVQRDKKGKLQYLTSVMKRSNGYHMRAAYTGKDILYHYLYDTTYREKRSDNQTQQVQDLSREFSYKALFVKASDVKGYQMAEPEGPNAIWIEQHDTSMEANLGFSIISHTRRKVDLAKGLISETAAWVNFEGGTQYSRVRLMSIQDSAFDVKAEASRWAAEFRTYQNSDSLYARKKRLARKLIETGDTIPAFGGRWFHSNDSALITRLDSGIYVFDFFYTTCGPCSAAVPELMKIDSAYRNKGVRVIGIDPIAGDWKRIQKFKDYHKLEYSILKTPRTVPQHFGVEGYPTLLIVQHGRVRLVQVGFGKDLYAFLCKELDTLLAN